MGYGDVRGFPIREWAIEDRPREKMALQGANAMSNTELMAIILGSGTGKENAVDLSRRLLSSFGGSLHNLEAATINELTSIKGIGIATATRIKSALILGRRLRLEEVGEKTRITTSSLAWEIIQPFLTGLKHEEFWIALLNRANILVKTAMVSKGGISGTLVDAKIIYTLVLESKASGIILFHNHPSGNTTPSEADKILTKKLCQIAKVIEVQVLDHIIVGEGKFFSFADHGILGE